MVGARRFVPHVIDVSLLERRVQRQQARTHSLRLLRTYTQPKQMDFTSERRGITEGPVVITLRIELFLSRQERTATAEAADVREQIEVIQGDLEGFHPTQRQSGHRAMIAVRFRPKGCINERNERSRH